MKCSGSDEVEEDRKVTYWNVPVPKPLDEALEEAIQRDWHRTKAEFIRDLVRHALENMGFYPKMCEKEG